jgi:hypothetical protein
MEGKDSTVTPPPPPPVEPSNEPLKFQLRAFYSDIPIDFVENDDVVKGETDLWGYVNDYIKDDIDELDEESGQVIIYQNDIKIPGSDEAILYRPYKVGTDSEGRYMKFLGPEYEVLHYRLLEITDDYFIIYLKWKHGSTIYSRFERVR